MSVLKIIRKLKEKDQEIRLLILGLDNAGKTTVMNRFLGHDVDQISPTVGFNIQTIQYKFPTSIQQDAISDTSSYSLTIWDVGGQSTIRSFWGNYLTKTDGLIWVIDSTDITRFDLCRETFSSLLQCTKLSGVSILILANKQDIFSAYSCDELIKILELKQTISEEHHWFFYGCQAKSNSDGIIEGFSALINDITQRLYHTPR